eukprot:jgi/Psemu1/33159/gm1.33159_g
MASLEQLQMLDDDETTTSTSSSNSSSSINGTDDVANGDTADDASMSESCESSGAKEPTIGVGVATASGTGGALPGHPKKRIKLSLGGGTVKAVISSTERERENQGSPRVEESARDTSIAEKQASRDGYGDKIPGVFTTEKPTNSTTSNGSVSKSAGRSQSKPAIGSDESFETKVFTTEKGPGPSSSPNGSKDNKDTGKQASEPLPTAKQKTTNSKPKTATSTTATASKSSTKEAPRPQPPKKQSSSSSSFAGATSPSSAKKRSSIRSIRIIPMSSPGLLLPPGNNLRGSNSGNATNPAKMVSPNDIFSQTLATAGYTSETRTKNPHRGSSVQRVVDDMFDSDVKFCLQFPKLVPKDWFHEPSLPPKASTSKKKGADTTAKAGTNAHAAAPTLGDGPATALPGTTETTPKSKETDEDAGTDAKLKTLTKLSERLIKAFQARDNGENSASSETTSSPTQGTGNSARGRKRGRAIPQYSDIVPLSLSMPYPDEYFQNRLEYITKVNERERDIVLHQEQQETLDADPEENTESSTDPVPPIPPSPLIPEPKELQGIVHIEERFGSRSQQEQSHPLYLPGNQRLVDHLDKRCFHVMSGRYFGLESNAIADPYFVGPSAPGIGGLNLSATTGLATASTGGGAGSLGGPLLMTPGLASASVVAANNMSKSSLSASSSSLSLSLSFESITHNIIITTAASSDENNEFGKFYVTSTPGEARTIPMKPMASSRQ